MATNIVWPKIDGEHVQESLQEVIEKLEIDESEVVLDCSSVRRLDPGALRALEQLAKKADARSVKIVLRGLNVEAYKVLKLVKLSSRFQ